MREIFRVRVRRDGDVRATGAGGDAADSAASLAAALAPAGDVVWEDPFYRPGTAAAWRGGGGGLESFFAAVVRAQKGYLLTELHHAEDVDATSAECLAL